MKTIPVLLIGALLFVVPLSAAAGAPSAFEQRCEAEMKPQFEVSSRDAGYRVNNTLSSRLLNNRASYATVSQSVMGMTASHTMADIGIDGPALADQASGRECIAPRVSVELSYQPLDVYVAREFNPYSCPFRVVIEHELRHVQVYREQLPRIEATVRRELAHRYADRPLYAAIGEGLNTLHDDIDAWLRPLIKAELAAVELIQRQLDNPEEERRLSQACQGEVASMMGSSF
jgi:hypothetical protein